MTLSPMVTEWAEAYEQELGHKPTELVLQIAEHIQKVGKLLTKHGQRDAREGKKPYPADYFPTLVVNVFRIDIDKGHETVQVVADLWQSDYMDGYNTGEGSAHSLPLENARAYKICEGRINDGQVTNQERSCREARDFP